MSQEIELYNRLDNPSVLQAVISLGQYFAKSGFAGCNNEAQGVVLAWECAAKRKSPSDILAENHIANGRLSRKALAIAARFQEAGGKIRWLKTGEDGKEAEAEYAIEGETVRTKFSIEDAKTQGLIDKNPNWRIRPGNMLRSRCHTNGIGMLRPALVLGIESEDAEVGEITPKELLPSKTPTTAQPAEPKPANVSEVRAVTAEPPLALTQEAAPTEVLPPSTPTPPAKLVVTRWDNPKDPKKVSAEGAAALAEIIPAEKQETALRWLENKGWILPKGSLLDLSPAHARAIYDRSEDFLKKIGA